MTRPRPRILLADDHEPFRAALAVELEEAGFDVAAQAGTGPDAVRKAARATPDLCLLDIGMPGNGIAAAWEIAERLPDAAVVMLTSSHDEDDMYAALRAGADGYLLKDEHLDRVDRRLRAVLEGETLFPPRLLARLRDEACRARGLRRTQEADCLEPLERDVLDLLAEGLSAAEAATRTGHRADAVRAAARTVRRRLRTASADDALSLAAA